MGDKTVANAVGGKTARACDGCVKKRAKWYCAADDAFLCQFCDSTVHSANPLARRHERVRLKTASFKSLDVKTEPSWHRGFKRKARTPRHGKAADVFKSLTDSIPFVPELRSDEISDEEEHQLLYTVPIFDPFVAELCGSTAITSDEPETAANNRVESKECFRNAESVFVPSDLDLADFAADVESLLGRGLENESFGMEELGLADCKEEDDEKSHRLNGGKLVKLEEEESDEITYNSTEIDMAKEPPFELSFDYDYGDEEEEEEKVDEDVNENNEDESEKNSKKNKTFLSLDYDAIISSWATKGCPWTNGNRPEINLNNETSPDWIMGNWGGEVEQVKGVIGGREARVSRYREKRRTRLFSKKIRYQVRKLNAEKRPRMKGRFVKRATFAAACLHSK